MLTNSPCRSSARLPLCFVIASVVIATLGSCGQGRNATSSPAPVKAQIQMLDEVSVEKLRERFLEVAGSDRVAFASGSAELSPRAKFQLERQALWLAEHGFVAVRFRSETTSPKGVEQRRLAVRRSEAVQDYLKEFGVQPEQFVGVDVEFGRSGTVTTLIDPFHFGAPVLARS